MADSGKVIVEDDRVILKADENNQVVIHKFGATVTSWICQGREIIFLSSKAVFDKKKAIRGGIPVVFPNFGPWELGPQHGFARISNWEVTGTGNQGEQGDLTCQLTLSSNAETKAMWDHEFKLSYLVTLRSSQAGGGLLCELTVCNTGTTVFDFTTLLHTYLRVDDVEKTSVSFLGGLDYVDKLKGGETFKEENQFVSVVNGADRVYKKTVAWAHEVVDGSSGHKVVVSKTNLPDTVVWNPWVEGAKKMSDFDDEEYRSMICIEPGAVSERVVISPGESKSFKQTLSYTPDDHEFSKSSMAP